MAIMAQCDSAVAAAEKTLKKTGDPYATYAALEAAQGTCQASSEQLAAFKFSDAYGPTKVAALKEMRQGCSDAYLTRSVQMDLAARMVNGDASPEAVYKTGQARDAADAQAVLCVNGMVSATAKAGLNGWDIIAQNKASLPPKEPTSE